MFKSQWTAALIGSVLLAAGSTTAHAAVDFSGYWILKSDPQAVPAASVTPAAAATVKKMLAANDFSAPNGSPEYAKQFCTVEGMPWQMTHALPLDIRQGTLTVSITPSVEADPRHIYIDGQKPVALDEFDYTSVGHSIGRWQGDVLVASTVGFGDQGVKVIPGGALRTEKTRLTERYQLTDRNHMKVTFTWTDPSLRKPHTYTYEFERAQGPVWMTQPECSPIKAMRQKGLKLPPGAPLE